MARLLLFALLVFGIATSAARLQRRDNSDCAQWCSAHFTNPGKDCTSQAAHGVGPCYNCGPLSNSPSKMLCQGTCTDTSSDNDNCGSCGNACLGATFCLSGTCSCNPLTNCGNQCVNVTNDPNNCGACGTVCGTGSSCTNGACTQPTGCSNPGSCGNFDIIFNEACQPFGDCTCARDSNGAGVCVEDESCSSQRCTSNSDCASGVCWTQNCCGFSICATPSTVCQNPARKLMMMSRKAKKRTGCTLAGRCTE